MVIESYCVCILSGKNILLDLFTKIVPLSFEIQFRKGDICTSGKRKGLLEEDTSIRIIGNDIKNLDIILEKLVKYLKKIKKCGINEFYLDYICKLSEDKMNVQIDNNHLYMLNKLKTDLLISIYSV